MSIFNLQSSILQLFLLNLIHKIKVSLVEMVYLNILSSPPASIASSCRVYCDGVQRAKMSFYASDLVFEDPVVKRASNFPCQDDVWVTSAVACPPPMMTKSFFGVIAAVKRDMMKTIIQVLRLNLICISKEARELAVKLTDPELDVFQSHMNIIQPRKKNSLTDVFYSIHFQSRLL